MKISIILLLEQNNSVKRSYVKLWWSWLGLYVRCLVSSTYYHCDCVIRTSRPDQHTVLFWRNCVHTRKYFWVGYIIWQLPSSLWSFLTFLSSLITDHIVKHHPTVCLAPTYMYTAVHVYVLIRYHWSQDWEVRQSKMMTKLKNLLFAVYEGISLWSIMHRTLYHKLCFTSWNHCQTSKFLCTVVDRHIHKDYCLKKNIQQESLTISASEGPDCRPRMTNELSRDRLSEGIADSQDWCWGCMQMVFKSTPSVESRPEHGPYHTITVIIGASVGYTLHHWSQPVNILCLMKWNHNWHCFVQQQKMSNVLPATNHTLLWRLWYYMSCCIIGYYKYALS